MTCKDCIHCEVCTHYINSQNDTYAYMGYSYDFKNCKYYKYKNAMQEVKHAKWESKSGPYGVMYCSNCNHVLEDYETEYCCDCGAKMDKE